VIDLHLHTTVSDGALEPHALVEAARQAGLTTIAVTDHDTLGAWPIVDPAARAAGLDCLPGIEITAVLDGRDVHVLAYGVSPAAPALAAFLGAQRDDRRRRLLAMAERLSALGAPVDPELIAEASGAASTRSLGRPALARALVAAGLVRDVSEAFDRYLGEGRPAFVERGGPAPARVFDLVHAAGGVASIAHPVKIGRDDLLRSFAADGLDAIEVYHPDHGAAATTRYRTMADALGLLVTGGSDYHGPGSDRAAAFGRVGLPAPDFARLAERLGLAPTHP
jgi:hypothetical protein